MRLRKNDTVLVIKGKHRGKIGKIIKAIPKENLIIVEGVNIVKKNVKPSSKNPKGGIIEFSKPIKRENAMIICPSCTKPTRIGIGILPDSTKVRICKKCKQAIV